jgi:hypothetical protein
MPNGYTIDPNTGEMVPAPDSQQEALSAGRTFLHGLANANSVLFGNGGQSAIPMPTPTPTPGTSLSGVGGQGAPSNMFRGGGYGGGQSSINAANLPSPGGQSLAARFLGGFGASPAPPMRGPAPSFPWPNPNDQTAPLSPGGLPIIAGPGANPNVSPSGDVPYTGPGAGAPSNGFGAGSTAPLVQANPIIAGPGANRLFHLPSLPQVSAAMPRFGPTAPANQPAMAPAPRPAAMPSQQPYTPNANDLWLGNQAMGSPLSVPIPSVGQRVGNQPAFAPAPAQAPPVQGPLAALGQQPNSPFTMILRPNAPANTGGRGGGGTPLGTALDLSGYQPAPPPAPPSVNLGYGAQPARAAPRAPQHTGISQPFNPLTARGPHGWRDNPGLGWGASVPRSGGRMSPQGVGVTEFMGP